MAGEDDSTEAQVAAIREKFLDGRAPVKTFAAAIGKCERTVRLYIARGMPVDRIGQTPYAIVDPAIEWIRTQHRKRIQEAPRPRGRPRKSAAHSSAPQG